jgi:hypothetical protein
VQHDVHVLHDRGNSGRGPESQPSHGDEAKRRHYGDDGELNRQVAEREAIDSRSHVGELQSHLTLWLWPLLDAPRNRHRLVRRGSGVGRRK